MHAKEILTSYIKDHSVFEHIHFSKKRGCSELLPSIFVMTQKIIDSFISKGENRILVIMPDSECTVFPMLAVKLIDSLLNDGAMRCNMKSIA